MFSISWRMFVRACAGLCCLAIVAGCRSPAPTGGPSAASSATNTVNFSASQPASQTNEVSRFSHPAPPSDASDNMAPNILDWDAVSKEYQAKAGEDEARFTFNLTNVSPEQVIIYDTSTTCDCTVAKLPAKPWLLMPGATGEIHASLDLRGKTGIVSNYVIVFTSKGNRLLSLKADIPKS